MFTRRATVGVVVLAAALAGTVYAWARGDRPDTGASTGQVIAASAAPVWPAAEAARFKAIPQQGNALGNADAPVLIVVFEDLQCTVCRQFAMNAEDAMIDRLVATGKARALLYPLTFVGPQSVTAASWAYGASRQGAMWQFADAFFQNAGQENSGYATAGFLRRLSSAVPGLDGARQEADASSPGAQAFLSQARALAKHLKVSGTPSVYVGTSPSALQPVAMISITDYAAIAEAVDAAAHGRSATPGGQGGQGVGQCSLKGKVCSLTINR
jgi:protein-disulfide isomerase